MLYSSERSPNLILLFLPGLHGRWLVLSSSVVPFSPSSSSSSARHPQAQNTQQTGFKGNLRLLVKTLEQPHLPFKILPAALSHCLHSDCLPLLLLFLLLPTDWAREDTLLRLYKFYLILIHAGRYLQENRNSEKTEWAEAWTCTTLRMMSVNIWSLFAFERAGVFLCVSMIWTHVREQRGLISHNRICYITEAHLSITQHPIPLLTTRLLPHSPPRRLSCVSPFLSLLQI